MFKQDGNVVRVYVSQSGKFGSVTLDCQNDRGSSKIDFITFDCIDDFRGLSVGRDISVEGRIGVTKLVAKDRSDVKIDGFSKWVPSLIVEKVTGLGAPKKAAPKDDPATDDDIPF